MNRVKGPKVIGRGDGWLLVVREPATAHELARTYVPDSDALAALVRPRLEREVVEVMLLVAVDGRNRVVGLVEVARGGLHGCSVTARDILRAALMVPGCSAFSLAHNHPSGCADPSPEDARMTRAVAEAADVVGCPLLDHVVVAGPDHRSLADLGLIGPV